ncbi:Hypothetical protein NAEGRDRAFT_71533 [Naegleria gruberi]|uniref:Uncharacterized protein n=1 Tax=Naegleria gruberi TaxID=5762 RepID=D2VRC1_NAEGR|nr:uncharacterized protein NAEGRDRAFT_71533 [Naegleria gruberi]EFC40581.1 Hypothetical protein NAEGRDRAFT_71533 [Naegleria gruberi]|eukprot:XP_002673325.1 Hypothetical protein NAEGRDRAFT_71533 [Naegleria gruberi strain NEG-M]
MNGNHDDMKTHNDSKAKHGKISTPGTPVRSKSPTLPKEKGTKSSERMRESWKTPEEYKSKAWTKPSAWGASKMDRFKDSKQEAPPATKYNLNLSSLEIKEFNSMFKSQSPRFKDARVETPPATKYSVFDPNLSKKGDLTSTCFKTTTKREYETEIKPKSPGPLVYEPVIQAIDAKKAVVSSFRSSFDRFREKTPSSPPSTKYNTATSSFSTVKKEATSFGSTSPRFDKVRTQAPPATKYDTSKYSDFNKTNSPNNAGSAQFRSSTDRFFRASEKAAKLTPPATKYTIPSNLDEIISRPPTRK